MALASCRSSHASRHARARTLLETVDSLRAFSEQYTSSYRSKSTSKIVDSDPLVEISLL